LLNHVYFKAKNNINILNFQVSIGQFHTFEYYVSQNITEACTLCHKRKKEYILEFENITFNHEKCIE